VKAGRPGGTRTPARPFKRFQGSFKRRVGERMIFLGDVIFTDRSTSFSSTTVADEITKDLVGGSLTRQGPWLNAPTAGQIAFLKLTFSGLSHPNPSATFSRTLAVAGQAVSLSCFFELGAGRRVIFSSLPQYLHMSTRFDDVAKWTSIMSGAVAILLAIPSLMSQGEVFKYGAIGGGVVMALALVMVFRRSPYDLEFLEHIVELDIQEDSGRDAMQTRRTRLRALRSGVETVTDHLSADGEMSQIMVSPGVIKQVRREGGDIFLTSSIGRVLAKGETVERVLNIRMKDTFVQSDAEYWSVRVHHPMTRFTLRVAFPKTKSPKAVRGLHRVSTYEKLTDVQPKVSLGSDGRAVLLWTVQAPAIKDVYKVEWDW